ncbi:hypothetical protein D3C71_376600 [compost metagenome]
MRNFLKHAWAYTLEISNVGWFLLLTTLGYVVLSFVLCQYLLWDTAIMLAQMVYVLVLGIGLSILHVIRRQRKLRGYPKRKDSYFKILILRIRAMRSSVND